MSLKSIIQDLREKERKATESPWETKESNKYIAFQAQFIAQLYKNGGANADLIVSMRNNLKELLDAAELAEELQDKVIALEREIEHLNDDGSDETKSYKYS